ncbi:MAG: ATP-binding protein [Steroidobacteraceae bacterium]|jgi:two-component system sensor histidine kinase CpxA
MHSLFLRIFMLFWMAMALIVAASIAVTYAVAAREYESQESQRRPPVAIQASEVLAKNGIGALRTWLQERKDSFKDREFFIVGPDGADILGRHLSSGAERRLESVNRDALAALEPPPSGRAPPQNFRPSRAAPQIVAPDGSAYTVLFVPHRPSIFGALSLPGITLAILAIALVVSALTCWWLAQHLSAPIRRIQAGARALASENLDVRVSAGLDARKDEVAVLARDFDAMADQLRSTRTARTQLLRDISHELRSPLARMRVALGLARQPQGPARQLERLELEVERLDALIGRVLRLARLHDSDTFTREPLDIDEVVEAVVRDANFEGAAKNCRVELTAVGRAVVQGNRDFLGSAVENVLRNAVRYSPHDAVVNVSVRAADDEVQIAVGDRGPGVPAEELERIFEPFHRVADSRDRASGGEGIGLAITSQVMKAHGGSASAVNRPGGGLEVTLALPARTAA